jgi:hypothetical protein
VVAVNQVDHQKRPRNVSGYMARAEEAYSDRSGSIQDIEMLGATAFDDLLASEQVIGISM